MASPFEYAVAEFITQCRYVVGVHDLVTKWRLELQGGYILDLYFNETLANKLMRQWPPWLSSADHSLVRSVCGSNHDG